MDWKDKAIFVVRAALFSALAGSVIGALCFWVVFLVNTQLEGKVQPLQALLSLLYFSVSGVVAGSPFGLIAGLLGGGWLLCRSRHLRSARSAALEGALAGLAIGELLPLVLFLRRFYGGMANRDDLYLKVVIEGLIAGAITGALFGWWSYPQLKRFRQAGSIPAGDAAASAAS